MKAKKYNRYTYVSNFFEKIDTEEKAYWLGFLYADGCVRDGLKSKKIEITLSAVDKDHLIKFRNAISPNNTITKRVIKKFGKTFIHSRLVLSSNKIAADLVKLGCTPRKTKTLSFPTFIPKHLMPHFMRGYFDGDGSIWITKEEYCLSVEGNEKFLKTYRDWFLKELEVTYSKIYRDKRSENRSYKKQGTDAVRILRYLYKDASVYLRRKYSVFISYRRLPK